MMEWPLPILPAHAHAPPSPPAPPPAPPAPQAAIPPHPQQPPAETFCLARMVVEGS